MATSGSPYRPTIVRENFGPAHTASTSYVRNLGNTLHDSQLKERHRVDHSRALLERDMNEGRVRSRSPVYNDYHYEQIRLA